MGTRVVHISAEEAASDFAALLERVRAGDEVVIEDDARPVAVVRAVEPTRRTISECMALAEAHAKELGYEPTLDPAFAADLAEIIDNRQPWKPPAWE